MKPDELRNLRLGVGLTQQQLGEAIGVSVRTVRRWEAGRAPISRPNEIAIRCATTPGAPRPYSMAYLQAAAAVGSRYGFDLPPAAVVDRMIVQ